MEKIPNKLIISGNWAEAFYYESPHFKINDSPFIERVARMPRPRAKWNDPDTNKVRSDFSLNRTKNNIRRIVNFNTDFSKFITLTFKKISQHYQRLINVSISSLKNFALVLANLLNIWPYRNFKNEEQSIITY